MPTHSTQDGLMCNFFKEHSYNVVKLFLNQIGITVFGTMLALATSGNPTLLLFSSIFATLFLLVLDYNVCWEIGAKDKIKIDGGRLKPMSGKGAVLSLLANVPNLILSLLMGVGVLIGTSAGEGMSVICNAVARLLNGMYLGIIKVLEFVIYTEPKLNEASRILTAPGASAENSDLLTLISSAEPGNSVEPIRRAMELMDTAAFPEAAEVQTLLEGAYYSPSIADIWWWFLVITVPAILTCYVAYLLGSKDMKIIHLFSAKNNTKQ